MHRVVRKLFNFGFLRGSLRTESLLCTPPRQQLNFSTAGEIFGPVVMLEKYADGEASGKHNGKLALLRSFH